MPGKMTPLPTTYPAPSTSGFHSPRVGVPAAPRPIFKTAIVCLVATTALLLLINSSQLEFMRERDRPDSRHPQQQHGLPSLISSTSTPRYPAHSPPGGIDQGKNIAGDGNEDDNMEQDQDSSDSEFGDDEKWRFDNHSSFEKDDQIEENEDEHPKSLPVVMPPRILNGGSHKDEQEDVSSLADTTLAGCPTLFLHAKSSIASFASSSTAWSSTLDASEVTCKGISSLLSNIELALCQSKVDCSRGFIQVVHHVPSPAAAVTKYKVSNNAEHNRYFNDVAGPDDYYILLEGSQRLALSAKRYHHGAIEVVAAATTTKPTTKKAKRQQQQQQQQSQSSSPPLVYRADFRMTLPGSIRMSAWLTYENFRAIRENRPGVWPQWSHTPLVNPGTEIGTICPDCELDSFVQTLSQHRQQHFDACDRMSPVRGAYWREDLAAKMYKAEQDPYNAGPGAGAKLLDPQPDEGENDGKVDETKPKQYQHLTKGWRFVPQGCTMTKTDKQVLPPSSQQPLIPTCDSIETKIGGSLGGAAELKDGQVMQPVRNILFTGDSQVRTTYNMILGHHRPYDLDRMKFPFHTEYISIMGGTSHVVMLEYKADQFLSELVNNRTDDSLDVYDTIYLNLGQWPASGPVAGGQWSTEQLMTRWHEVIQRLTHWRDSRAAKGLGGSRVIWAGENAFPMRTDHQIRTKVDWRTNARLGFWDDLIELTAQQPGGWFRRLNAWALTFPMLDEIVDRAHYQETDAIDAIRLEALYKLDLCSAVVQDAPYGEEV